MFSDHICLDKLKFTPSSWRRNVLEEPNLKYHLLLLSSTHYRAAISMMSKIPVCLEISEGGIASICGKKKKNMQTFPRYYPGFCFTKMGWRCFAWACPHLVKISISLCGDNTIIILAFKSPPPASSRMLFSKEYLISSYLIHGFK